MTGRALTRLLTSYATQQGLCAMFDGETTCDRPRGHYNMVSDPPSWHRFHDPSGSGRWIDKDAYGDERARGGGWPLDRIEAECQRQAASFDLPPVPITLRVTADLPVSVSMYGDHGGPEYGYVEVDNDREPGILVSLEDGGVNGAAQVRLSDDHALALALALIEAVRRG